MFVLVSVLIVLAAVLLIAVVLIQNSKGGGLAAGFASGNQIMGTPKTTDLLEKVTWVLISVLVVLSITGTAITKSTLSAPSDTPTVTPTATTTQP